MCTLAVDVGDARDLPCRIAERDSQNRVPVRAGARYQSGEDETSSRHYWPDAVFPRVLLFKKR